MDCCGYKEPVKELSEIDKNAAASPGPAGGLKDALIKVTLVICLGKKNENQWFSILSQKL